MESLVPFEGTTRYRHNNWYSQFFGFSGLRDIDYTVKADEAEGLHGLFFLMLCYYKTSSHWGCFFKTRGILGNTAEAAQWEVKPAGLEGPLGQLWGQVRIQELGCGSPYRC